MGFFIFAFFEISQIDQLISTKNTCGITPQVLAKFTYKMKLFLFVKVAKKENKNTKIPLHYF